MKTICVTVTVTTVPGQPTFELEGDLSNREIAEVVKNRYGKNAPLGATASCPHSFCASLHPAPEPAAALTASEAAMRAFNTRGSRRWGF